MTDREMERFALTAGIRRPWPLTPAERVIFARMQEIHRQAGREPSPWPAGTPAPNDNETSL